ncbi:MAG: dephospho-CoA kinase [Opitutales bacterium]|nr:dephospho-CoA kinase [Opitutales bacterium]
MAVKIAITGDIGSGKSTVLGLFEKEGFLTLSADAIAHELMRDDQSVINAIREHFGSDVLSEETGVDRKALAAKVFNDEEDREILEGILHPRIRQHWVDFIKNHESDDVAVEIPLLFEKKLENNFDSCVTVWARLDTKLERLRGRNLNEAAVKARLKAQLDQDTKSSRSKFVITNSGSLEFLHTQVRHCIAQLRNG